MKPSYNPAIAPIDVSPSLPLLRLLNRIVFPLMLIAILGSEVAHGQFSIIGNKNITAYVVTDPPIGRFYMTSQPNNGGTKFLFGAGAGFITSNIVFRIESNGQTYYFCNAPNNFGFRPRIGGAGNNPVPFKPFDSLYVSRDTLAMGYKNMYGFNVTVRLIPEGQATVYDDGAEVLIEFSVEALPFAPAGNVGVFLMLDTFNGESNDGQGGGGGGDDASVITDRGYFPFGGVGKIFQSQFDTMPTFYHVGNVSMQRNTSGQLNNTLSIGRLSGLSHLGSPLTKPDMFAVGSWNRRMRDYSWDVISTDVGTTPITDHAIAMRWEKISGGRTVRTSFGQNHRFDNNMFHCRDSGLFVDIKTVRVIEQKVRNGAYSPTSFDVEMWVTNLNTSLPVDVQMVLETPIMSNRGANRLLLDASTPASQSVIVPTAGQMKLRWRLNFNPVYNDDSADVKLQFRYKIPGKPGGPRLFRELCNPTITIKKFIDTPPPVDTIAPVIARGTPGRTTTAYWPFTTFDRHAGYNYDTGLDKIVVERNDNSNFRLVQNPLPLRRCDITLDVGLVAEVIDTARPAMIVFAVYDCRGNVRRDSAQYSPRPDLFAPEILRIDSSLSAGPGCNTRIYEVYLIDSLNQGPDAGDNGFGMIDTVGTPVNFIPIDVNFERGSAPIADFDRRASLRTRVIDSMFDGSIGIRFADYAGNADTLMLTYCTMPDVLPPLTAIAPSGGMPIQSWDLVSTDTLAWDRGISEIVVLSNIGANMLPTIAPFTPGARQVAYTASVIDDKLDAEITFEVRDIEYQRNPAGHADTVTLRFLKIPDTLAPNIVYTPLPGSGGAIADVVVNDIHYIGALRYRYDLGLSSVNVLSISPNMRIDTPIMFAPGDSVAMFRVAVIDTLAFGGLDSICLEAIDLAGNRTELCYYYPVQPDNKAPVFVGRMDRTTGEIVGQASDQQQYDRGLASVTVVSGVNTDPSFGLTGLNGQSIKQVRIALLDPLAPIQGTLVIRDMVAERDTSVATQLLHTTTIPFDLPTVELRLELPDIVEHETLISAAIVASAPIDPALVDSVSFRIEYGGYVSWNGASSGFADVNVIATGRTLDVGLSPTRMIVAGDTLALLVWDAPYTASVEELIVGIDPASLLVNGGLEDSIAVASAVPDASTSMLLLPSPLLRIEADSVTVINGDCDRVLVGGGSASKTVRLAILGLHPLPLEQRTGEGLTLDIRDLPQSGGSAELIDLQGNVVARFELSGFVGRLGRIELALPGLFPSGYYVLRVVAGAEMALAPVILTR